MHWCTKTDEFTFTYKFHRVRSAVIKGDSKPTKREILSLVMAIFDPFGILGNLVISGKLMMQWLWKLGVKWDEPLPNEIFEKWQQWLEDVRKAELVRIPRCYEGGFKAISNVELHIFADASEAAMAAVAYFRITTAEGVTVRLACTKTRCAPIRYISIPRLELQAAVIAVRLKNAVLEMHNKEVKRVVYWSDSMTVLNWINSDSRRYKQYVANRLGEILENSHVREWHWVPTEENVADEGTRLNIGKYVPNGRWCTGPEFLKKPKNEWPTQPERFANNEDQEEIKSKEFVLIAQKVKENLIIDWSRFSKYSRIRNTMAWVRRFITNCKKTHKNKQYLSSEELEEAEQALCRAAQRAEYAQEYKQLETKGAVDTKSSLVQFNPYLDKNGVMRISGRIENASWMSAEAKRLILLPKKCRLSELVVAHYHQKLHHINKATVVGEIRQKFWIPSIRAVIKKVENDCNFCKVRKTMPRPPMMGLLPVDRLTPYVRPFTYTGIDFFGPVMVTVRRQKEKRWVALFTCLTIRAVHLELAANLSSDACLLCIRNFMNRRGVPKQIRSDNGTNFVGLSKELKDVEDFVDHNALEQRMSNLGVHWVFNCPSNPSEGGVWERLVQSVKRVLTMTLKEQAPKVETLISYLIEAENIVNARPLTNLPVSTDEDEPLTPNHFLLNTTNSTQTPGPDSARMLCLRKQWRIAQTLKNSFWKRWIKEYLPELTRRVKWCQPTEPLREGDLVLICEGNVPRSEWQRGRILQLNYGPDKIARSAEVQVQRHRLKRPVSKLAKLDVVRSDMTESSHGAGDVAAKMN